MFASINSVKKLKTLVWGSATQKRHGRGGKSKKLERDASVTKGGGVNFGRQKAASRVTEFMNGPLRNVL